MLGAWAAASRTSVCPGNGHPAVHLGMLGSTPSLFLCSASPGPGAHGLVLGKEACCLQTSLAPQTPCAQLPFCAQPCSSGRAYGNSSMQGTAAEGSSLPGRPPPAPGVSLACLAAERMAGPHPTQPGLTSLWPKTMPQAQELSDDLKLMCRGCCVLGTPGRGTREASGLHLCVPHSLRPFLLSVCPFLAPDPLLCSIAAKQGVMSGALPEQEAPRGLADVSELPVLKGP